LEDPIAQDLRFETDIKPYLYTLGTYNGTRYLNTVAVRRYFKPVISEAWVRLTSGARSQNA
jgi:hypothetical protein